VLNDVLPDVLLDVLPDVPPGITDDQAMQMAKGLAVTGDLKAAAEQIKNLYKLFTSSRLHHGGGEGRAPGGAVATGLHT